MNAAVIAHPWSLLGILPFSVMLINRGEYVRSCRSRNIWYHICAMKINRQSCSRKQDFLSQHSILAEQADQVAMPVHQQQQKQQTTNPSSPVSSPTPNTHPSNSENSTSAYPPPAKPPPLVLTDRAIRTDHSLHLLFLLSLRVRKPLTSSFLHS